MNAQTIFDLAQTATLTTVITEALHEMVESLKGKVSGKDKKVIRDTTEKIVQATMEDVYRFDPKFQAITDTAFKRKPTIHYRKGHLWADAQRRGFSAKSGRTGKRAAQVTRASREHAHAQRASRKFVTLKSSKKAGR